MGHVHGGGGVVESFNHFGLFRTHLGARGKSGGGGIPTATPVDFDAVVHTSIEPRLIIITTDRLKGAHRLTVYAICTVILERKCHKPPLFTLTAAVQHKLKMKVYKIEPLLYYNNLISTALSGKHCTPSPDRRQPDGIRTHTPAFRVCPATYERPVSFWWVQIM